MRERWHTSLILLLVFVFGTFPLYAEADSESAPVGASTTTRTNDEGPRHRWFDLQTGTLYTRYQYVESDQGDTLSNQQQHKEWFNLQFRADSEGRFTVNSVLGSGTGFTGSWDGIGQ